MAATLTKFRPAPRRTTTRTVPVVPAPAGAPTTPPADGPAKRSTDGLTATAVGLLLVGAVVLAFAGYLFGGSRLSAERAQGVAYDQVATSLAEATVPVSGALVPGTPLGVVEIPDLGLKQVFFAGSSADVTADGPGLKPDSALPGQVGSSVLVGRRTTFGAPFRHLADVKSGDTITVTTGQGTFTYEVDLVRRSDGPATEIEQVDSRLTLVTADPVLMPTRMLQVSARLVGDAQPRSTTGVATQADLPGKGSSSRGVALLLWSQLLLVVSALVTWAATRVNPRAVWVGAAPVLLALAWHVFEDLAVLLPNTF